MNDKKEALQEFHRQRIISCSYELFNSKGFSNATLDDISKSSGYCRRTIYAYFKNKEDIFNNITIEALLQLKEELFGINVKNGFKEVFSQIFYSIIRCYEKYPEYLAAVNNAGSEFTFSELTPAQKDIFSLGTQINSYLEDIFASALEKKQISPSLNIKLSIYMLWAHCGAITSIIKTKQAFFLQELNMSVKEIYEYEQSRLYRSYL